ncbi:hypothetical protein [Mycetocola zhujimingii]|uniref:hypothetical protein n=1 Tax=Mycetocola zhujimingii TaxID=2079792 RepID=UPI000D33EDA0|nr:hypothetical protein [Mycetocola zhujimingii]AWB86553.1 hypothetical protein C3E77_07950 [Mycetocola zhujimingii]
MSELAWILISLASAIVAANVAVVVAIRAFYRRVRRNLALNGAALRVRSRLSRGRQREVLKLRVQLKETLDSGRAAMDLATRSDGPRGELPRLFRRLELESAGLESQLRLLESENDRVVLDEALATAQARVDDVTGLVRRLRSAVASGLGGISDDSLTALRSDVEREITAVRAGLDELHELNVQGRLYETLEHQQTNRTSNGERGNQP